MRFALLSPCGRGNLGDAAIMDSVIHGVRRRVPGAQFLALTLNPEDTEQRHQIEAMTCSGFSCDYYGLREPQVSAEAREGDTGASGSRARKMATRFKLGVRQLAQRVPGISDAWEVAYSIRADLRHRRRARGRIDGLRAIIVAGGGQLDEFWGGPFGHPYVLSRWAREAGRIGAQFVVLSVGTGVLDHPLSRYFVRDALTKASYRSFRDARSRSLIGSKFVDNDPTVPDLAFATPVENDSDGRSGARARSIVAVSPICYGDPRVWPLPDGEKYARHVRSLSEFVQQLLERNYEVRLFSTNSSDARTVQDVSAAVRARVSSEEARALLQAPETSTVSQLFEALADADVVVAARLHGVLLSQVMSKPVMALSYERKVETLMRDSPLRDYCVPIGEFDARSVWPRFSRLLERRTELARSVTAFAAANRREVERQYDRVFGSRK